MDVLGTPMRVGDLPCAAEELHRFSPLILDAYAVRPDVVALLRLRLILEIERANGDRDAARRRCVVGLHDAARFSIVVGHGAGPFRRNTRCGFNAAGGYLSS